VGTALISVGRAPVGRMEVRFAIMLLMMGFTLAEGTTLVRSEVGIAEVRFKSAEE
jgi:hypothetical protein